MAKTSHEIEKEFIQSLKSETGRGLKEWMTNMSKRGIVKRNDLIKDIKEKDGFGHMNASMLVAIYLNAGKPVYGDPEELLNNQLEGKEHLKPLYENLKAKIHSKLGKGIIFHPTKMYVSIQDKKEFAIASFKSKELRIGMDLPDNIPFDAYIQKSKSLGAMPRISHMIVVTDASHIDSNLMELLRKANNHVKKY